MSGRWVLKIASTYRANLRQGKEVSWSVLVGAMRRVFNGASGKGPGKSVTESWSRGIPVGMPQEMTCIPGCGLQFVCWAVYPGNLVVTDTFTQDENSFLKHVSFQAQFIGLITSTTDVLVSTLRNSRWNYEWKLNCFCFVVILCNTYATVGFCMSLCTFLLSLRVASVSIIHYYYLHILCIYEKVL